MYGRLGTEIQLLNTKKQFSMRDTRSHMGAPSWSKLHQLAKAKAMGPNISILTHHLIPFMSFLGFEFKN